MRRRRRSAGLCLALLCAAAACLGVAAGTPRSPPAASAAPAAAKRAGGVDPRDAWALLVKRSEGGKARDGAKGKRAKVGAPGPPGPRAPAGAHTTAEELLRELQRLLQGAAKEQQQMSVKACEGCEEDKKSSEDNVLAFVPSPLARSGPHHRVEAAFHCRTRRNISVEQRSLQELQIYYIPEREGMFHRGLGLNLTSGQYTAPVAGYYTFTATLHIVHRGHQRKGQQCPRNRLRVLICVQSLCQHDSSLETVSRLESSGDLFTVSVNGVLYLQAGQYASVFVDNTARSPVTVQSGSDFSAVLLGV
ncbi:erythroferrone [Struthio camelus]|uniref:erythroferrone n=1 Tax=Struthio camelus TaxID=8801 RepID=UPI0036042344